MGFECTVLDANRIPAMGPATFKRQNTIHFEFKDELCLWAVLSFAQIMFFLENQINNATGIH